MKMRSMLEYAAVSPAPTEEEVLRRWNTPIAFLYGGLAVLVGVIAVALLLLACSCGKPNESANEEKSEEDVMQVARRDIEPRFAVIMAGEANPSCIAKPAAKPWCSETV